MVRSGSTAAGRADAVRGPGRPQGSMGLPLLGETLAFVRNPYSFLEVRRQRYGDVFVTTARSAHQSPSCPAWRVPQRSTTPENVSREDAHPFLMTDMFGGTNFEMYDGARHLALKTIALRVVRPGGTDSLPARPADRDRGLVQPDTPAAQPVRRDAQALREPGHRGDLPQRPRARPGTETAMITRDYGLLLAGLSAPVPLKIPGTPYGRSMAARDRLLVRIQAMVQERRADPTRRRAVAHADGGRARRPHLHRRRGGARGPPHRRGGLHRVRPDGRGGPAPRHRPRPAAPAARRRSTSTSLPPP